MPTLADALELAEAGWRVLPLRGKLPITPHGVLDASSDPGQVQRWWAGGVRHNIGARVPELLLVLDVDPQNGGSIAAIEQAASVPLPVTMTVHSGRGTGGQHRYYRHPGGTLTSTRLPGGVDVKTSRGYCVMPPSLHPATGQPYRWEPHAPAALPARLLSLLRPQVPQRAVPRSSRGSSTDGLVRYVEQLGEGRRNAGLYWAACRAVEEGAAPATFEALVGAAGRIGLDEVEARRTIASAQRQVQSR